MKNTIKNLSLVAIVAVVTFSFTTIEGEKKEINKENSQVAWKGYKVTGSHEGIIAIEEGALIFNEEKLVGGEFVINMTTLISAQSNNYRCTFSGHVKINIMFRPILVGIDHFRFGINHFTFITIHFQKWPLICSQLL